MSHSAQVTSQQAEAWMKQAIDCAQHAPPVDVPVGCILVDESGTVVAEGWNRRELDHTAIAHAEIVAMQQAHMSLKAWRLKDLTAIVTLEPCPMCASALLQAQIKRIIYGAPDPIQGALDSALDLRPFYGHDVEVIGGILEDDCKTMLKTFFEARRHS